VVILFARSSTSTRARPPPREVAATFFLKNTGIQTSSTRTETSAEKMLREQLAPEQESSAALVNQVDELKRKIEKMERELEE
jgi:uncharacterized protein YlxW (UPF0749 family)